MRMAMEFTDQNFDEEVLKSDRPVLVDFWTPWCGPCQIMGPIVEELSKEIGDRAKVGAGATVGDGALRAKVVAGLPYALTGAQARAVAEIAQDMEGPFRMNRLLQGDVGAGKTLVAFLALLIAVEAGGQGVMMAPTEILARQHFAGLEPLAAAAGVPSNRARPWTRRSGNSPRPRRPSNRGRARSRRTATA